MASSGQLASWLESLKAVVNPGFSLFRKDEVIVPYDLPEGDYVLGFRWDTAGGQQVCKLHTAHCTLHTEH